MSIHSIIKIWQDFWFKPQSPLAVCIFRILFGLVILTHIVSQYWQDFHVFFGEHPFIPYDDYIAYWWRRDFSVNIFEVLPANDTWHISVLVITAIFVVMMIVGFWTRFSTFVTYLLLCSIDHQYPLFCNSGDNMQRVVFFLLIFTRAGDGLSLDSYIKNRKTGRKAFFYPPPSAPWAQRMLQCQMCLAYISTALLKINSTYWFSGNGCYLATRLIDFVKFSMPIMLDHRFPLYALCLLTVVIEVSLGTLIWIKEIRYLIILFGVILHLGIDWLLNIPIFEFVFLSMFSLFVEPQDFQRLGNWFILFFRRLFKLAYFPLKFKEKKYE